MSHATLFGVMMNREIVDSAYFDQSKLLVTCVGEVLIVFIDVNYEGSFPIPSITAKYFVSVSNICKFEGETTCSVTTRG